MKIGEIMAADREITLNEGKKTVPVYKRFRNFFDYEKELRNVKEKKHKKSDPRFAGISKLLKRGE